MVNLFVLLLNPIKTASHFLLRIDNFIFRFDRTFLCIEINSACGITREMGLIFQRLGQRRGEEIEV